MLITKDMATESCVAVTHTTPVVAYCGACNRRYFVAFQTFTQTKGLCSCSWRCCATAHPGNASHPRHIRTRPATLGDIWDAEQGIIKDFREV